jgi:hypothetical protein
MVMSRRQVLSAETKGAIMALVLARAVAKHPAQAKILSRRWLAFRRQLARAAPRRPA